MNETVKLLYDGMEPWTNFCNNYLHFGISNMNIWLRVYEYVYILAFQKIDCMFGQVYVYMCVCVFLMPKQ